MNKNEIKVQKVPTLEIKRAGKVILSSNRITAESLLGSMAFLDEDVTLSITLK